MKLQRTLAFSLRALLQFRHDRRTLAFILIMPLLMILIFGYTFGGDVKNVTVEVVNQDTGLHEGTSPLLPHGLFLGGMIIKNIDAQTLSLHENINLTNARQTVHDGHAWAAIIFPANFTQEFLSHVSSQQETAPVKIEIYLDASNPTISAAVIKAVTQSIQATLKEMTTDLNRTKVEIPITIDQTYAYGGSDTRFIDYFAPGVISFAIMMVTTMITIIL